VPASQVPPLTPGPHAVVAKYLGDQAHQGSQGATVQEVEQAATTVALTSDPNPSDVGEEVEFEAVVKPQAAGGPAPTGTVTFEDGDGNALGSQSLDGEGKAEWETDSLSASTKIVARYGGDANYTASSGSVTQSVGPAATATIVGSSSNPAVHGEEITWTATVRRQTPGTPPEGTIGFAVDGSEVCPPAAVDAEGKVTCAPDAPLSVGEHSVVATFEPAQGSGDEASEGSLEQRVVPVRTSLDLSVDPEPSTLGAPITLLGEVSALGPSAAEPTGDVQFALDGEPVGDPVELSDGAATLETSCDPQPLACTLPVGAHAVEAAFVPSGSDAREAKASAVHWVRPASTTTTLQSSANPQRQGERVRFTATVSSLSGLRPFGAVQFLADGAPFSGPVALQGGTAVSPPLETLPPGTHEIQARFLGSGSFSPSSASLSQEITRVLPPSLRVVGRRVRVRPNGTFALRLRCGGTEGQRCRAHVHVVSARRVRLSTGRRAPKGLRLAIRSVEMPTTKKRSVVFDLAREGVRLLSGRRSLLARVRIDPHLGTLAGRAQRVRLVLPKRGLRVSDGRRPGGGR